SLGMSLTAVACISTSACLAVGNYTNSSDFEMALAEGWNGKEWAIQALTLPEKTERSYLVSISCIASNACTAVGYYEKVVGIEKFYQAFAERWNGTEWALQTIPSLKEEAYLQGV